MLESSLCFGFVRFLWRALLNSRLFGLLAGLLDVLARNYRVSRLRQFLLGLGNVEPWLRSSLFYRLLNGLVDLVRKALRLPGKLFEQDGPVCSSLSGRAAAGSFLLNHRNFYALGMMLIFAVPHVYWKNTYGLLLAVALGGLCLMSAKRFGYATDLTHIPLPFFLFFFALVVGVLVSYDPGDSLRVLSFFVTSFVLCFTVNAVVTHRDRLRAFLRVVYFALLCIGFTGIVQRVLGVKANASLTDLTLNANMPGRVFGTLGNPNNFAEFLTVFLPFGFAFALCTRNRRLRLLALAGLAIPLAAIVLTYSRSGWIALAAATVVYLLLANYRHLATLLIGGVCALPLLPATVLARILTIGNLQDSSSSYRLDIWTGVLRMLKNHWFTGVGLGPGGFSKVYPPYAVGTSAVAAHSHNQFLEMMAECGILGLLTYLWLIFDLIRRTAHAAHHALDDQLRHGLMAGAASIAGISLIGLFEYCWFYPRVMFAFFISAGLCLAMVRMAKTEKDSAEV